MTRYCPKCGEAVPSNSITCPKCYAKMPAEEPKKERKESSPRTDRQKSRRIRLTLTVVPAFFGILGLGQIYRNYRSMRGYIFLLLGILFFYTGNTLLFLPVGDFLTAALKTFFGVGLLFVYVLIFLLSLFDSLMDYQLTIRH